MKDNKNLDEIEIEQIDLDIDQNYDVSLDISSLDDFGSMPKSSSDASLDEIEVIEDVSEKQDININKEDMQQSSDSDEDKSVSISNDELDSILSDATLEEEEGVTVDLGDISELESTTTKMDEDIFSKVESIDETSRIDIEEEPTIETESVEILEEISLQEEESTLDESIFTKASEAITTESEIVSRQRVIETSEETLELGSQSDLISISTEDYNKLVEEEQGIPLVDRPEEILDITEEETISLGEPISPEEIGISPSEKIEEVELAFEDEKTLEISEETVISDKILSEDIVEEEQLQPNSFEEETILESPMEISETGATTVLEEIEKTSEEYKPVTSFDEDIELETEVVMGTEEKRKEFSVMPDEVGVEEIIIEQPQQAEEILGIGFGEDVSKEEEISLSSETYSEEVISEIGVAEIPTESEVTAEESIITEERASVVEEAIDTLPEQDKEDIRKILTYLDKLLESLPEDKIKEFASSEYYDLYIRIFDKLKIK
ncbi:MAG: hypothetical protein RMJ37_02525 [Spirochaetia bacterium]|nr:hypothetical protein [Spirochaetota bacterium]MCX8096084.1 hypothetical protein [Spirochaetota bacterium]MDW8112202.1 hypothetical protein [Spirochaetia bacterium]